MLLDIPGVILFGFHGNINKKMRGREQGTISGEVTKSTNDRWVFWEPDVHLEKGDIIYYWTFIRHFDGRRKLGYVNDNLNYRVNCKCQDFEVPSL